MSNVRIDRIVKELNRAYDFNTVEALWRFSGGNREKAFKNLKDVVKHYGITDLDEFEFDCICGELNDGVEVEWAS